MILARKGRKRNSARLGTLAVFVVSNVIMLVNLVWWWKMIACEVCEVIEWINNNHSDKFPIKDSKERNIMFKKLVKEFIIYKNG